MKKIVILIIVGIVLILSATFLYINIETISIETISIETISNDMIISKAPKGVNEVSVPTDEEVSLDAIFGEEESTDNFDDIVM